MGEAYFAWHNESEGINNHQLRGMYYNWKSAFGTIFSHRGSTFTVKVPTLTVIIQVGQANKGNITESEKSSKNPLS